MKPNRIEAKFFVAGEQAVDLPTIVLIFQRWIQQHRVEGLLIDVADYKHVPDGPGVILVGHEGDYALDVGNGRSGLLYRRKREWACDDLQEQLRLVIRLALQACVALEKDGRFAFCTNELTLTFPDRLNMPNAPETFAALHPALDTVLTDLYAGSSFIIHHSSFSAKRPFTVHVHVSDAPEVEGLLARISVPSEQYPVFSSQYSD